MSEEVVYEVDEGAVDELSKRLVEEIAQSCIDPSVVEKIRNTVVSQITEDILSVQPMDPKLLVDLWSEAKSEQWLRENGYRPVSGIGLVWVKG